MEIILRTFKESGKWCTDFKFTVSHDYRYDVRDWVLLNCKSLNLDMVVYENHGNGDISPICLIKREEFK